MVGNVSDSLVSYSSSIRVPTVYRLTVGTATKGRGYPSRNDIPETTYNIYKNRMRNTITQKNNGMAIGQSDRRDVKSRGVGLSIVVRGVVYG